MDKSKIKGLAVAIPIVIIAIFLVGEEKKFEEERESQKSMIEESKQTTETESLEISQESSIQITPTDKTCDHSYPDVCISPWPPDLDCNDITHANFRVLQPDQHGFDQDKDGIGCEK